MVFKDFCTLVEKWRKEGIRLKIKDLSTNEADNNSIQNSA